jgi:hypothetical protein
VNHTGIVIEIHCSSRSRLKSVRSLLNPELFISRHAEMVASTNDLEFASCYGQTANTTAEKAEREKAFHFICSIISWSARELALRTISITTALHRTCDRSWLADLAEFYQAAFPTIIMALLPSMSW